MFGDEDTFLTNNSQLTRVKDALDKAQETITGNLPSSTTDARGAQGNEDVELVTSALNIAQTEIQRAQVHLSEWNAIGDMRIKQVQVNLSKMDGYIKEVQTRLSIIGFLERQQVKLQADYEKGIQIVRGG